jgi:hypothetical protein
MKTKIATVISLAGVLVAGSAAALVNTQVLGGSSPSPLVADAASQVEQTTPTDPVVTDAATPASAAPAVAAAPSSAATHAVYQVGDSGTVTLDTAGGVLRIVSVTPAAGWTVTKSESDDGHDAEITFQSGTSEVEFDATLLFGVVSTSVESDDPSASSESEDSDDDHDDDSEEHDSGDEDD